MKKVGLNIKLEKSCDSKEMKYGQYRLMLVVHVLKFKIVKYEKKESKWVSLLVNRLILNV